MERQHEVLRRNLPRCLGPPNSNIRAATCREMDALSLMQKRTRGLILYRSRTNGEISQIFATRQIHKIVFKPAPTVCLSTSSPLSGCSSLRYRFLRQYRHVTIPCHLPCVALERGLSCCPISELTQLRTSSFVIGSLYEMTKIFL